MSRFWSVVKWILGLGAVALVVCGGAGVFLYPRIKEAIDEQQQRAKGKAVLVAAAAKGELVKVVSAPGTIKPKSEVEISARVAAKIEELPFKEGERVKAGDIVVKLDANELQASLAAAQAGLLADLAALKTAEAQFAAEEAGLIGVRASLTNARLEWERQQELHNSGDVSRADLDRAQAELDRQQSTYDARQAGIRGSKASVEASEARVKIAEAQVKRAQDNLEYTIIRSPIDGFITLLSVEVGELAVTGTMNNPGTVLMKIADLSEMIVKARIAEVDVNRVKEAQTAKVFINGFPDVTFNGVLRRVALESRSSAGDQTTFFEVEVVLQLEGQAMFAGLSANVDIETETVQGVVVPSQAVLDKRIEEMPRDIREGNSLVDQDKTFARVVYVFEDGKAKLRPVKVSGSNLTRTAITDGLAEGVQVITGPFRVLTELTHDSSVRLQDDEKKKEGEEAKSETATADGSAKKDNTSKPAAQTGTKTADAGGKAPAPAPAPAADGSASTAGAGTKQEPVKETAVTAKSKESGTSSGGSTSGTPAKGAGSGGGGA